MKITKKQINDQIKTYAPDGIVRRTKAEIVESIQLYFNRNRRTEIMILFWTLGFEWETATEIVNNIIGDE